MSYPTELPKVETNSFHIPYEEETWVPSYRSYWPKREFRETYFDYIYDENGNRTKIRRSYEGNV